MWEDDIKMDLKETGGGYVDWIKLASGCYFELGNEFSGFMEREEFFDKPKCSIYTRT